MYKGCQCIRKHPSARQVQLQIKAQWRGGCHFFVPCVLLIPFQAEKYFEVCPKSLASDISLWTSRHLSPVTWKEQELCTWAWRSRLWNICVYSVLSQKAKLFALCYVAWRLIKEILRSWLNIVFFNWSSSQKTHPTKLNQTILVNADFD